MNIKKFLVSVVLVCALSLSLSGCFGMDDGKTDNNNSSGGDMMSQVESMMDNAIDYKDGEYSAEADSYDDQGYKPTVKVTVQNGKVKSVDCDAISKEGKSKKQQSKNGEYNMKAGGAKYQWHEEIANFEQYVVNSGVDSVKVKDDQKTDTITGCTIKVKDYVDLVKKALNKAKM